MAEQGNSLLRRSPCSPAGHYRLGASAIQVRQHAGGCPREAAVRSFLHQERLAWPGSADYVPDHQDRAAGTRSPMRMGCGQVRGDKNRTLETEMNMAHMASE